MSNVHPQSSKDKNSEEDLYRKMERSRLLSEMCGRYCDIVDDGSAKKKELKTQYEEDLKNEYVAWVKLNSENLLNHGVETSENVNELLTDEQQQYIKSGEGYQDWLKNSNEFRKKVAIYLKINENFTDLRTDYEQSILGRIESAVTSNYLEKIAFDPFPK